MLRRLWKLNRSSSKPFQIGMSAMTWKTLISMLSTAVMILMNGRTSLSSTRRNISNSLRIDIISANRALLARLTTFLVLSMVVLLPVSGSIESTLACWIMISSRETLTRSNLEMERLSSHSTPGNAWALRRQIDKLISSSRTKSTWIFSSSSSCSLWTLTTVWKTLLTYTSMPPLFIKPKWSRKDSEKREERTNPLKGLRLNWLPPR